MPMMRLLLLAMFFIGIGVPSSAQVADPRTSNDYANVRKELWISQFKEALRKKPEALAYLAAARSDPDQAWTNQKLYDAFNKLDKYGRAVPGAGSSYGILSDLYKDAIGHPYDNWLGSVGKYFNEHPESVDAFARQTYADLLRAERGGRGVSDSDIKFKDAIKSEISNNGSFAYIGASTKELYSTSVQIQMH
jgi:hypothetical protein